MCALLEWHKARSLQFKLQEPAWNSSKKSAIYLLQYASWLWIQKIKKMFIFFHQLFSYVGYFKTPQIIEDFQLKWWRPYIVSSTISKIYCCHLLLYEGNALITLNSQCLGISKQNVLLNCNYLSGEKRLA